MDNKSNISDNTPLLLTGIKLSSTLNPPTESIITSKSDSGANKNYCRNKDELILLDVQHKTNGATVQLPNNEKYLLPRQATYIYQALFIQKHKNPTYLITSTVTH